jgi:hypothetical protein
MKYQVAIYRSKCYETVNSFCIQYITSFCLNHAMSELECYVRESCVNERHQISRTWCQRVPASFIHAPNFIFASSCPRLTSIEVNVKRLNLTAEWLSLFVQSESRKQFRIRTSSSCLILAQPQFDVIVHDLYTSSLRMRSSVCSFYSFQVTSRLRIRLRINQLLFQ